MKSKMIEPLGHYAIESIDQFSPLTESEESGILAGLEELDVGEGIPLTDVVCRFGRSMPDNPV